MKLAALAQCLTGAAVERPKCESLDFGRLISF